MDYSFGAAIAAGVVATVVITAMLYMGMAVMPRQMPMNILYMLGTMPGGPTSRDKMMAYTTGTMMHVMMGIALAIAHVGAFVALDLTSALIAWGVLFGFVHWIMVGMGMGMIGAMHPLMRAGQMTAPGPFVSNLPKPTVVGFLMVHLVYGLVVAALYDVWA